MLEPLRSDPNIARAKDCAFRDAPFAQFGQISKVVDIGAEDRLEARKHSDEVTDTSRTDGLSVVANRPRGAWTTPGRQTNDSKMYNPRKPTSLAISKTAISQPPGREARA